MSIPEITPITFPRVPVSTVTPFTYRDGLTYLQVLECLRRYMNETLIGSVNETLEKVVSDYNAAIDELVAANEGALDKIIAQGEAFQLQINELSTEFTNTVNELSTEFTNTVNEYTDSISTELSRLDGQYQDFVDDVNTRIESINNKSGMIDVIHATLTDDNFKFVIDPLWPTNLPLYYVFTQDSVGSHTIPDSELLTSSVPVFSSPFSRTVVTLVPVGDGTWMPVSQLKINRSVYNVMDYGAKGDRVADDSGAIQAAIDAAYLAGGGTVFIPTGDYWCRFVIELRNQVNVVGDGVNHTVLNLSNANGLTPSEGIFFIGRSEGIGYGAGPSNFRLADFTIAGDFDNGVPGSGAQLHHSKNVVIENIVAREINGGGHVFDLMGCDGITIKNCKFLGKRPQEGRRFTEAIQFDHSTARGFSLPDDPTYSNVDGLPCINMTVEGCEFLPYGGYPAPNGPGSHTGVEGMVMRNIVIRNCVFKNWEATQDGGTPGPLSFSTGITDLIIENNIFVAPAGNTLSAIYLKRGVTVQPITDIANRIPSDGPALAPIVCKKVIIRGNSIDGNGSDALGVNIEGDWESGAMTEDIRVEGNAFNNYAEFLLIRHGYRVVVADNTFIGTKRAMYLWTVWAASITGNVIGYVDKYNNGGAIKGSSIDGATITGNVIRGASDPFWLNSPVNTVISGNSVLFRGPLSEADGGRGVYCNGGTGLTVTGNLFSGEGANGMFGVRLVGPLSNATVFGNTYKGCATKVSNGTDGGSNIIIGTPE